MWSIRNVWSVVVAVGSAFGVFTWHQLFCPPMTQDSAAKPCVVKSALLLMGRWPWPRAVAPLRVLGLPPPHPVSL